MERGKLANVKGNIERNRQDKFSVCSLRVTKTAQRYTTDEGQTTKNTQTVNQGKTQHTRIEQGDDQTRQRGEQNTKDTQKSPRTKATKARAQNTGDTHRTLPVTEQDNRSEKNSRKTGTTEAHNRATKQSEKQKTRHGDTHARREDHSNVAAQV